MNNQQVTLDDIRRQDLEVETSRDGTDIDGHPFYIWRESKDNRMGLSRPRYCCITPVGDELYFTFFNPSEDVKSTGFEKAFAAVCALMAVLFVVEMIADRFRGVPGPGEYPPAPLFSLIAFTGTALGLGALVGYVWHAVGTVLRWRRSRFEGDGRINMVPWKQLNSFRLVTPEENGVERDEKAAKGGHGLQATFGIAAAPWPLTINIWNARSIIDQHREMTVLFVVNRDECMARWEKRHRKKAPPKSDRGTDSGPDFDL